MNGGDSFFVDSNVLLYWIGPATESKRTAATIWISSLWNHEAGRISWQVIQEFYSNATGKLRVPPALARYSAEQLMAWDPEAPSLAMLRRAWHWCDKAQINYWDAMIVAAAEQSGSRWLLSEDFQTGRTFGEVTVLNPFERAPAEFGLSS